jgi:hypothetical protein
VGSKSNNTVIDLIAYQSELKRIIALGVDKSRDSTTKNKAITATYTLESDYQQTVKIINARHLKPTKSALAKYTGKETDTLLDAADKANNFDEKYNQIYLEKLTKYKAKLAEVFPELKPNEQVIIKSQNNNVKVLLGDPLISDTKQ